MSCMCAKKLLTALENLKNLPLAALAELLPANLPVARLQSATCALLAGASLTSSAHAHASAVARLAAQARLSASLSASAVARLEALAFIHAQLGINPLSAQASAQLALTVKTMNLHLPPLMAMLLDLLAPLAEALAALAAMLTTAVAVQQTVGLNLAVPGMAARLAAAVQARVAASATVSASVSATASATANLAAHMRLVAAAQVLGINLLAPGGVAKLVAALKIAAHLSIPPLNINFGKLGALAAALGQITAAQAFFKINFLAPNAMRLLAAALAALLDGMSAVGALNLTATATASASAAASAAASLTATATAALKATAAANFTGLHLPLVLNLGHISLAANFAAQLGAATGVQPMQTHPCSSCPVAGAF